MEKVEYLEDGLVIPKRRNSHCFVQQGSKVYIYGGANDQGPLNDAFILDLETSKLALSLVGLTALKGTNLAIGRF